ncbi:MAG: head-tail adaptor protein [Prevotella sp.]|nr:head-tail adaptor protein [Prevotella sp.]
MSFANNNILDIALSLIPPTAVQIRKNTGSTFNKYGQAVATYGDWIEVYGIVQPGSEQNEHVEGIDLSKKRVTIWLRGVALDGTHIQWAPDQIRYVGRIFNVVGVKDWYPYDNYRECECVEAINLDESQRGRIAEIERKSKRKIRKQSEVEPQDTERHTISNEQGKDSPAIQKPSLVGKAMIRF